MHAYSNLISSSSLFHNMYVWQSLDTRHNTHIAFCPQLYRASYYMCINDSQQLNPVVPGGHTHSLAVFGWKGLGHLSTHMELL